MFEGYLGADDPAQVSRVAHDTAAAVLSRVRADPDPEVVARLVSYTDEHGIDAIAELWSKASAKSLPGALWRLYLLRTMIRQDAAGVSLAFQRGAEQSHTIDQVVAGAPTPAGPAEVRELADVILRGVFSGDFAWHSAARKVVKSCLPRISCAALCIAPASSAIGQCHTRQSSSAGRARRLRIRYS